MNNKIRFVVLNLLMIGLLPVTILAAFVLWLGDLLSAACKDYRDFYYETWREK